MKVTIIVGTRPQIIKSAPVYDSLSRSKDIECSIVNTGQHYDYRMNREFFEELNLPDPEVDLGIGAGDPNQQISKIILGLDRHFSENKTNLAIIPGDTNSALAAGIACSKLGIKVAHLESGCRSDDFRMSEEVNRRTLDHISNILLCPTQGCYENLISERVLAEVVENVGDTMLDSLVKHENRVNDSQVIQRHSLSSLNYALMTLHRAENVDNPASLESIFRGIAILGSRVILPIHPRTLARLSEFSISLPPNVETIDPVTYFDSLRLIRDSAYVITDSGGVQKEAFWMKKPTIITRQSTEWEEIVRCGASILVGNNSEQIGSVALWLGQEKGASFVKSRQMFGDGKSAESITSVISKYLLKT